ncbi:MAG: hypothetical protein JSS82_02980 [Bacteroidetes bacterium]|nr:hypothetical protein [Bacteroidota bacterium]
MADVLRFSEDTFEKLFIRHPGNLAASHYLQHRDSSSHSKEMINAAIGLIKDKIERKIFLNDLTKRIEAKLQEYISLKEKYQDVIFDRDLEIINELYHWLRVFDAPKLAVSKRTFKWIKEEALIYKLKDALSERFISRETTDIAFGFIFSNIPLSCITDKIVWTAYSTKNKQVNKKSLIDLVSILSDNFFIDYVNTSYNLDFKVTLNHCFCSPNGDFDFRPANFKVPLRKVNSEYYLSLEEIIRTL